MFSSKIGWVGRSCFWTGVVVTTACVGLVAFRETKLLRPLEQGAVPLSWILALSAALLFLVTEVAYVRATRERHKSTPSPLAARDPHARSSKHTFAGFMEQFHRLDQETSDHRDAETLVSANRAQLK